VEECAKHLEYVLSKLRKKIICQQGEKWICSGRDGFPVDFLGLILKSWKPYKIGKGHSWSKEFDPSWAWLTSTKSL
jgi:hypothetical protein